MKSKKHNASEFFYDDSFSDYKPYKESLFRKELSLMKKILDLKYILRFFIGYNVAFYFIAHEDRANIYTLLIWNAFFFAMLSLVYFNAKKYR